MEKSKERLEILEKIDEFERMGKFDQDVENDPPTIPLNPSDVDYLHRKITSKIKTRVANHIARKFIKNLMKEKKLIIKDVIGLENLDNIKNGFILTCNHFNAFDNFALHEVLEVYLKKNKKRFFKVIREGNYSFPGLYGFFFRNCDTLPLSSNFNTMKKFTDAINIILKRGDVVLVYPEQGMWWNYKKPRPLKSGAFRYAVKADVPVLPCFITMNDSDILDDNGFYVQEYTLHFSKPIYPNKEMSIKESIEKMTEENYQIWKEIYENTYQIPLVYKTEVTK